MQSGGVEALRVAIDVGGTFTDGVAYDPASGRVTSVKVLTRVSRPWVSVVEAIERLAGVSGTRVLIHATTLGTNMLLGQVGLEPPNIVLITSKGFRDIVEIGRQARPEPYNMFFTKPRPLVPRYNRLEVDARLYPDGSFTEPSVDEVERLVTRTCSPNTVYVVALIHCYVDEGRLENRIASLVKRFCPEALDVLTSCSVDPSPGEYERFSTAIVNAMLRPLFRGYLERLLSSLRQRGFTGKLLVMQSSGGVAPIEAALEKPVLFIESGPAAGVVAASTLAKLRGDEYVVSFDMGGTTAKAALVIRGEPYITEYFEVGGKFHAGRLVRGSGYPVRAPHVDLVEVSAGGGTIAWVDAGGALRVGPLSAGAEPGPACYGKGGLEPTVTDAHFLLGRLPPVLANGLLTLDASAAMRVYEALGKKLGLDAYDAAAEVLRLVNVEMARAIRLVTIERGVDPSLATLYAFGGAGPLHAAELAEELGISRVVIPPYAGVFSALGLLLSEFRLSTRIHVGKVLDEKTLRIIEGRASIVAEEASRLLSCEPRVDVTLLVGFSGQLEPIRVAYARDASLVRRAFLEAYKRIYGYLPPEPLPSIVVNTAIVTVYCEVERPKLRSGEPEGREVGKRRVYYLNAGWVEAKVYRGIPRALEGPAILELSDTTVVVPPGWMAKRGEYGEVILEHM